MIPYRVRSRKAVKGEVLEAMERRREDEIRFDERGNLYTLMNHLREMVCQAYGYDPHLFFEQACVGNGFKVIRHEEYEPSRYRKRDELCEIDLRDHDFTDIESHNKILSEKYWSDVLDVFLLEVEKVLISVRAYTERGYSEVKVGSDVVALNNRIYMSDDFELATEGSDSFRVLELNERWVHLKGKGIVGWNRVLGVF